jgi:tetratricopeptide (TPR) repeat protein
MFVRVKTVAQDGRSYEYLQIVRSVRDGARVRQELVASLGRRDLLVATGLEQAARLGGAAVAYAAIAKRWPDSLPAWIGLGNAAYAAGDLDDAEAAFRTAARRHPNAAAAWNNLAHVLGQKGRRVEAVAAAQRAVRLGGPNGMMYRETLREVAGG